MSRRTGATSPFAPCRRESPEYPDLVPQVFAYPADESVECCPGKRVTHAPPDGAVVAGRRTA